jgi:agmatinase
MDTSDVEGGFLGLPEEKRSVGARVHVLPVPYEATVSYGKGARGGPRAIILASQQVELYDPEFDSEPALSYGIHTLPSVGEANIGELAAAAESILREGNLLLSLGGEHSITPALVRGVCRAVGKPLTVVQIDAHADLRNEYGGTPQSHACAMRRSLEETGGRLLALGIRSFSMEEACFIRENSGRVTVWTAEEIERMGAHRLISGLKRALKGSAVYLTIDVDGLDPSVIPATGTPEPGGLSWQRTCEIVKTVAETSRVVALDCVELAPREGLHMAEFTAAKLLYKALSWILIRPAR